MNKKEKEQEVYNEDGMRVTLTRDPELVNHHNMGYCSLALDQLKGRVIEDVYYQNIYFDRDGKWELDISTIEIKLKKVKGKEIDILSIQSDPENNPGGYLNQMNSKGESYRNTVEGERHLTNRGMANHIK
jgi:hypothetical protein